MNATPETVIDVRGLTKSFGHKTVVRATFLSRLSAARSYGFLGDRTAPARRQRSG